MPGCAQCPLALGSAAACNPACLALTLRVLGIERRHSPALGLRETLLQDGKGRRGGTWLSPPWHPVLCRLHGQQGVERPAPGPFFLEHPPRSLPNTRRSRTMLQPCPCMRGTQVQGSPWAVGRWHSVQGGAACVAMRAAMHTRQRMPCSASSPWGRTTSHPRDSRPLQPQEVGNMWQQRGRVLPQRRGERTTLLTFVEMVVCRPIAVTPAHYALLLLHGLEGKAGGYQGTQIVAGTVVDCGAPGRSRSQRALVSMCVAWPCLGARLPRITPGGAGHPGLPWHGPVPCPAA